MSYLLDIALFDYTEARKRSEASNAVAIIAQRQAKQAWVALADATDALNLQADADGCRHLDALDAIAATHGYWPDENALMHLYPEHLA